MRLKGIAVLTLLLLIFQTTGCSKTGQTTVNSNTEQSQIYGTWLYTEMCTSINGDNPTKNPLPYHITIKPGKYILHTKAAYGATIDGDYITMENDRKYQYKLIDQDTLTIQSYDFAKDIWMKLKRENVEIPEVGDEYIQKYQKKLLEEILEKY